VCVCVCVDEGVAFVSTAFWLGEEKKGGGNAKMYKAGVCRGAIIYGHLFMSNETPSGAAPWSNTERFSSKFLEHRVLNKIVISRERLLRTNKIQSTRQG
jgi:hypothetical protein